MTMKKQIITLLLCAVALSASAQNAASVFGWPSAGGSGGGVEISGALTRDVKLGETLSAGAAIDVIGNVWGTAYEKTANPDTAPGSIGKGAAMSADGMYLAVGYGTTAPYLITYKWSEANNRYEKTANPDTAPSGAEGDPAMSADGMYLAVAHDGTTAPSRLITYKWSEANNRYEKTANPDTAPSGGGLCAAMSADGMYLAVGYGTTSPYLITYKWSEANNRYEKTANPDTAPSGEGRGAAMSADGMYLAVSHSASGAPAYLITYKWSEANNRYEKTANPDTAPSGNSWGSPAMSADGMYLAVAHGGTTAPSRLITYKWSEANNRYEKTANPDTVPSGGGAGAAMSADGMYLAVVHDGTTAPSRLITYKWSEANNRYEKMTNPDIAPTSAGYSTPAMSADGTFLAVAHGGAAAPAYLVTYKLNLAGHNLKAYASQNKLWRMESHYTGILTSAGEAGDIVAAKMLTKTPADPLDVFGPDPSND